MSLPFLPANHIEPAFHHLTQQTKDATILKLIRYFKKTWITGFYQIASWCVFKQSTTTNNDVEGWHRRLNKKTDMRSHPSIYSSEDYMKKHSYFLSKGNWCQKESSQGTKENKSGVTRPLCLTFGMSTLQAASQQVDY